jgi:hypothetical protein
MSATVHREHLNGIESVSSFALTSRPIPSIEGTDTHSTPVHRRGVRYPLKRRHRNHRPNGRSVNGRKEEPVLTYDSDTGGVDGWVSHSPETRQTSPRLT